jgi:hypothetical protein
VLALYDGPIRKDRSAVALDMIDASALLWRLHLSGHAIGNRWTELASAWDAHADARTYAFNDWHAVMAYLGAGRMADVARIAKAYQEASPGGSEAVKWGRITALPPIEGFTARPDAAGGSRRGDPATLGEVADLLGIAWERGQGGIVGRDARMRCEKSGEPSAACAASLIRERRRSSSNGSVVSTRPEWYR